MHSRLTWPQGFAVLFFWLVITCLAVWAPAHASVPTRYDEMNALIAQYNSRFNFPEARREPARRAFIQLQTATFVRWKTAGAVHPLMEVRNDLRPTLIYTIQALEDEYGRFMALLYEQSEYEDSIDESSLRLFHRSHLESGVSVAGLKNLDALRFQIPGSSAVDAQVLPLRLAYALYLKKQNFAAIDLVLEATGPWAAGTSPRRWILRDPQTQRPLTSLAIEFWYSILSFNGGVKRLHLNSR